MTNIIDFKEEKEIRDWQVQSLIDMTHMNIHYSFDESEESELICSTCNAMLQGKFVGLVTPGSYVQEIIPLICYDCLVNMVRTLDKNQEA